MASCALRIWCAIILCIRPMNAIPSLSISGSFYEIGFTIGSTFKAQFQTFLQAYKPLNEILIPYYNTPSGLVVVNEFYEANNNAYPDYMDELYGMANGSNIDFYKILLLNIREEIILILEGQNSSIKSMPSCTDILVYNFNGSFIGHNEDSDKAIGNAAFLQDTIPKAAGYANFTSYSYPLMLAGNAFAVNSYGLSFSINAVFPRNIIRGQLCRQFITRDLLNSKNISDLIARLGESKGYYASGFSINAGSFITGEAVNIEVGPGYMKFDPFYLNVDGAYTYHFNEYLRLQVPQFPDNSSNHRLARVREMPRPLILQDISNILGDTEDQQYPIYRDGAPPDDTPTVASALFDLSHGMVYIYLGTNPKTSAPAFNWTVFKSTSFAP